MQKSSYSMYCINATPNIQQIHFRTASVFKQLNYILCTKFVYISRKGNDLVRTWQCKSNIFSGNCQVSLYIADYTYDDILQVGQFVRITNSICLGKLLCLILQIECFRTTDLYFGI